MDQVIKRTQQNGGQPTNTSGSPSRFGSRNRRHGKKAIVGLIIIIVIIVGAVTAQRYLNNRNGFSKDIKKSEYQAVFLTNGQVYFGKIDSLNDRGYTLSDIYYLQVQGGVQPDTTKTTGNQNLSLAKLGSELHGPEDKMYVESKQVLFWENLKDSGQVVKAIKSSQNK